MYETFMSGGGLMMSKRQEGLSASDVTKGTMMPTNTVQTIWENTITPAGKSPIKERISIGGKVKQRTGLMMERMI